MSIAVMCGCGQKYQVDDVRAGQSFRCKLCGQTSVVPYPQSAPYAVFLSYSAKDKGTAEAICSRLEARGIRCWMAPRDITPGAEWGEAILEGLARCRVMALVFSQHSNDSAQVRREVERAVHKGLPIIPFRIEDLPPSRSLEYFLSSCHWLDAFKPPLDSHLQRLEEVVRPLLGTPAVPSTAPAAKVSTPNPPAMPPLPAAVVPLHVALPEEGPRRTAGGVLTTCLMTLVVLASIGTIGWLGFDLFGERLLSALQDKPENAHLEPVGNDTGNDSPPAENGTPPAMDTPTEPATPAPEPGASALPLTGPKPADPPLAVAGAEGKRYAVIVGVESYDPEELNTLSFAVDDADALGAELTKLGFDVTLMTEKNARPQLRPNSAEKIQKALENRAAGLAPPDALVFAFLGHGVQFKSDQAAEARELYFCPEDARLADRSSLLSLERVCKVLEGSAAGHKLILVDACRNDPLPDQTSRSAEVEVEAVGRTIRTVPKGMLALFSCSDGETSREYPELGHGVFTHHVLMFLRGEAETSWYPDRQLSVVGLSQYVSRETKDYVWRQSSKDQIPAPYGQVAPWSLGAMASVAPRQPPVAANSSPAPAPLSPMAAPMPPPTTVSSTTPPAPPITPAPTPATPAPAKAKLVKTAAFLEDFKTIKLGTLPKDWFGDECIAVMTGSMLPPRLEASEAGQHVVTTSPVVIGDLFYLLIGLELGYSQPLKISLEGASGGRDLGWVIDPSQYVTTLTLPDGEPRSVGEVIVKKPGYIRLERDGDVFRTFVNASLADARRLPGFGNFEAIKLEIAGGQGAANSNTRIYGIQVAPIDPATIKTESPVPSTSGSQSWVKEDFRATKIGDLPTGWKGDDCIGVIKGGKAGARIEIGAEGKHGLTCPGTAIRGDFYLETEFDLGFGQTLVLTLLPEGGSPPLVLTAGGSQYVTPVTLADAGSKDAGTSVVRNRSKLRLEREGTTYRVYVNGEVTHARPLAGYGDFSGAAFQFDGGQAGAETRTHLYSLDVGPFTAP